MSINLPSWKRSSDNNVRSKSGYSVGSLQDEMNRLFESFGGGLTSSFFNTSSSTEGLFNTPAIDITESDKNYKVEVELPGMKEKDVDVDIHGKYLTIKAEKKTSDENKDQNYIRRERYYGLYQRTILLPDEADADKANAHFSKGVLTIEVPKREEAITKSRKLKIEGSE